MNLYDYIFKRKSTRKYDMKPLDEETLAKITDFANSLKRLYPEIKTSYEITSDVKNLLPIKATHYFLISSEETDGYLENAGFMWQQMDLFLSSLGLGSCWLGMAKPTKEINVKYPFVITLAFGAAVGSPYRERSEFMRKPISEVSEGDDKRIEAAWLAPSATNSQNWFFDSTNDGIDIYQKKVNAVQKLIYGRMNKIDIGIALCHLYVATEHLGNEFVFENISAKEKTGYYYSGTVR